MVHIKNDLSVQRTLHFVDDNHKMLHSLAQSSEIVLKIPTMRNKEPIKTEHCRVTVHTEELCIIKNINKLIINDYYKPLNLFQTVFLIYVCLISCPTQNPGVRKQETVIYSTSRTYYHDSHDKHVKLEL